MIREYEHNCRIAPFLFMSPVHTSGLIHVYKIPEDCGLLYEVRSSSYFTVFYIMLDVY